MGYSTTLNGFFELDKPLTQADYLKAFAEVRHMKRNAEMTALRKDPIREAVGLPVGIEGGYFVSSGDFCGQEHTPDVVDFNCEPADQPSLWCQWRPTDDLQGIEWDEGEKFYNYVEWLEYIRDNFLVPWGIGFAASSVTWQGEESDDRGVIYAAGDKIQAVNDTCVRNVPSWFKGWVKHGKPGKA